MAATYVFGEIPGHPVGTTYVDRAAAKDAGVHQVTQQGISGNGRFGANSIVVNGGYEDDQDFGDEIIYTGAGGNDPNTKRQVADQELTQLGNAGLVISEENALPVRVIRGSRGERDYSPLRGYRYDGLYRVTNHWSETGKAGFRIWRFRLVRLTPEEATPYTPSQNLPVGVAAPLRTKGVVQRVVRSTQVAEAVKRMYGFACQICDQHLDLPVGDYAEGAHIRGLGRPHDGPDQPGNLLCLCPNHHVLLDKGAIFIDDDYAVRDYSGRVVGALTRSAQHAIEPDHIRYHREAFGLPRAPR